MKKIKKMWKAFRELWFAAAASTKEMEQYYLREDLDRTMREKGF